MQRSCHDVVHPIQVTGHAVMTVMYDATYIIDVSIWLRTCQPLAEPLKCKWLTASAVH